MEKKLNVYLCGNKIGVLSEDEILQLTFQYDNLKVAQLSVNLPVRSEPYPNAYAFPFFENLTPEGEVFEILTGNHVSGNKTFSILDRYGGDCAGAVAFYEKQPTDKEELYEIPSSKIAQIIDRLPEDPLLTGMENPPRLSLAGAQSKFAIYKSDNKYFRSNDENPTTHIIKINNKRFPNLLKNELFCMKLAEKIQLNVPETELKDVDGRPYLEITRYDRFVQNGIVSRIHQEDFCQALGIASARKYQTGDGASLGDCYRIVYEYSDKRLADTLRFIEWIIFNYLVGNTDAHAKNISLLHINDGIKLAPFYDILSTEIYSEKIIDHTTAMLINGKGKYDSIKPEDFIALFEVLKLNATNTMKSIKDKFEHFFSTAEKLREKLLAEDLSTEEFSDASVFDDILAIIKKRHKVLFKSTQTGAFPGN
jgi:serine/threonine-protein kinase HipA